ncbi:MAG: SH3 domain-containing protein [Chloroflexi bacterium]|nr:SH3 domain-containing protein [Chloroflexota bacterium]
MQKIEIALVAVLLPIFILALLAVFIDQQQQFVLGETTPTTVSFPTFTNTPNIPAAQRTSTAAMSLPHTSTPIPPTATARPPTVIVTINMNVRQGPGTNYAVIGGASTGQEFAITGTESGARWWFQIDYNGIAGWIYAPLVTIINAAGVQVAANIPPPPRPTDTPVPPTNTPVPFIVQPANTPVPFPTQPPPATRIPHEVNNDNRNGRAICEEQLQRMRGSEQTRHQNRVEDIERYYARKVEDARERYGHSFAQLNLRMAEIEKSARRDREDERIRHERILAEIESVVCD